MFDHWADTKSIYVSVEKSLDAHCHKIPSLFETCEMNALILIKTIVIGFNEGVSQRQKKNTKSATMNRMFRFFFFFESYAMQTEHTCMKLPFNTATNVIR